MNTVKVENTSNPSIIKFVTDRFLTRSTSYEFKNIDEAKPSPLAQQLFYLPFVKTVYISQNFVAIEKYNIVDWPDVQEEVAASITEYLSSEKPVLTETQETTKKVPVTLYAESTPNPEVMKFVANKPLVDGTFEFKDLDDATNAPLVKDLFNFPFVKEVFVSANYVSIMKYKSVEWNDIIMELREFLRTYIENDKPVLSDAFLQEKKAAEDLAVKKDLIKEFSSFEQEIINILEEYVKPAVAGDGGHIAFESFDEDTKTVKVILQGACSGCPSSTVTLKNGIQTMLNEMLQGRVTNVEAING